jgi:SAM-dependent methyltransferase
MNRFHEANRRVWNAAARAKQGQVDRTRNWRECFRNAGRALTPQELRWLAGVRGKRVCVLGSGDNLAVFAFAGRGAKVTSVDISEEQLAIAARRAAEVGATIRFVRADVTDLTSLRSGAFDTVYTGGHVAVWVSDLRKYYREAVRILKPGGLLMVSEYHPFRRIWKEKRERLELEFGYFDRGPHTYDRAADFPGARPGALPAHEFHWTVSEYIAAVMRAGAEVVCVEEHGEAPEAWERAPLAGLPQALLIVARKPRKRRRSLLTARPDHLASNGSPQVTGP